MHALTLCEGCSRHVREADPQCPFCDTPRAATRAPPLEPAPRSLPRALIATLGVTLSAGACQPQRVEPHPVIAAPYGQRGRRSSRRAGSPRVTGDPSTPLRGGSAAASASQARNGVGLLIPRVRDELRVVFADLLMEEAMAAVGADLDAKVPAIRARAEDPYTVARALLARFRGR